jgi:Tfp pilus assembly protein PilN
MIKVNLLRDHAIAVEQEKPVSSTSGTSWTGFLYIAAAAIIAAVLWWMWYDSGKQINKAKARGQELQRDLDAMKALQEQFVELERKKQERQGRINIIEKLLETQKGPVSLMNAVIQAVPQNRDIWLTSLEQTTSGIKIKGTTPNPELLPDFMNDLEKSGIFGSVDIEQIERKDEISNFSILCANK